MGKGNRLLFAPPGAGKRREGSGRQVGTIGGKEVLRYPLWGSEKERDPLTKKTITLAGGNGAKSSTKQLNVFPIHGLSAPKGKGGICLGDYDLFWEAMGEGEAIGAHMKRKSRSTALKPSFSTKKGWVGPKQFREGRKEYRSIGP